MGGGCKADALHEWAKRAKVNGGVRAEVPTDLAEKMKTMKREIRESRQVNAILRKALAYFAMAEFDHRCKP